MTQTEGRLGVLVTAVLLMAATGRLPAWETPETVTGKMVDPTGRWTVNYQAPTSNAPHRLFVTDSRTNRAWLLYEFDRHVNVLWAPDGSVLAITDYSGSSESEIKIIDPKNQKKRIDVERQLVASLGKIPALYENGHRYFEAVKWPTPTLLRFEVHAHDAHPGKEYRGIFELQLGTGQVRQVTKP